MPKMKTHKGAKKRFKLTASGKVRYKRSYAGHLMSGKSGDHCRKMRRAATLKGAVQKRIRTLIA
jgi:large subunit ribosomal protein L35